MNTINLSLNKDEDNIILKHHKYLKINITLNEEKYN